jgi:hypothetical protein
MNRSPLFSAPASASIVADRRAVPADRLLAARALIDRGFVEGVADALADLADEPEHSLAVRKLVQLVKFVEQTVRWLDFEGGQPREGRWESPDGRAPAEALEDTAVLLWAHPGATRTAIAFSHLEGGFGPMAGWHSIGIVHRVLRPLGVNVVYLLDESQSLHFGRIRGLSEDYGGCLNGLKALLGARGWNETYTYGVSSGGFSALRYGVDLGARGVLSMSGPSNLVRQPGVTPDPRLEHFYRTLPAFAIDLLPLYRKSARTPRLLLCYGELNEYDKGMARRMAEFPGTSLIPFEGFAGHSTFIEALRNGRLGPLLQQLVADA